MSEKKTIITPLTDECIEGLKVGEMVYITGKIYTARDAAHKRMIEILDKGEPLPFDVKNQIVYYSGPCPAKPGAVIGSIGPTTSGRMDAYSPRLIKEGLRAMIGKGFRSAEVKTAIAEYGGVYFSAIGGAAALMSLCVKSVKPIAFDDLGTEAIRELTVVELPVIVSITSDGTEYIRH